MNEFSRGAFLALDARGRKDLSVELARYLQSNLFPLTAGLGYGGDREEVVYIYLNRLKALGHDLFSWDGDEDSDLFGYDYTKEGAYGLVIEFEYKKEFQVHWKEQGQTGWSD